MAIDVFELVISDSLLNTEFLVRELELKEVVNTAPASSLGRIPTGSKSHEPFLGQYTVERTITGS